MHVPFKEHLGVGMVSRHHLRKVYNDGLLVLRDDDVEFVEVPVNDSIFGESHYEVHQLVVKGLHVLQLLHVIEQSA